MLGRGEGEGPRDCRGVATLSRLLAMEEREASRDRGVPVVLLVDGAMLCLREGVAADAGNGLAREEEVRLRLSVLDAGDWEGAAILSPLLLLSDLPFLSSSCHCRWRITDFVAHCHTNVC